MKIICLYLFLNILTTLSQEKPPYKLTLTTENPIQETTQDFKDNPNDNLFQIQLNDLELIQNNQFFLVLESDNSDFILSILKPDSSTSKKNSILDLTTLSGSLMFIMDDKFFNGHLKFFKDTQQLSFKVSLKNTKENTKYKIKIFIQAQAELSAGKMYTTRIDKNIKKVQILLTYKKADFPNLTKLRFQAHALRTMEEFSLSSILRDHTGSSYIMNEVYKKTVGGFIDEKNFGLCKKEVCDYTLNLTLKGIKLLNIESNLGEEIEELSYSHFGPYYERKYEKNQITSYRVPFLADIDDLDISVSLTPVTGNTGLYINAKTKPLDLEKYDWKEKGPLAKRITIKNEELVKMQAEHGDLYISVWTENAGEYLLEITPHETGSKGNLRLGVIEAGFVKAQNINNYLYIFEVFEDQFQKFDTVMNIFSGDADLYLKQCSSLTKCQFTLDNLKDEDVLKVTDSNNQKKITHEYQCKHNKNYRATICSFAIGIVGKENHGTHYDISIQEEMSHKLITPNHQVKIELSSSQIYYAKFSYPAKSSATAELYLDVEAIWGNFQLVIDKTKEYPMEDASFKMDFNSTSTGLYNSLKSINLGQQNFKDYRIEGVYFLGIKSITSCALNLKFYEVSGEGIQINTLQTGEQQRGQLTNTRQIAYYQIKASLQQNQASSMSINLTPLKGKFIIFTSRKGKIPNKDDNDLISTNNMLELSYDDYNNQEEHIIGVQLHEDYQEQTGDFQFYINCSYSNKPLKLKPGVLSTHTIKEQNQFVIEITTEMADLLVLKSFVDNYQIDLCADLKQSDNEIKENSCKFSSQGKNVALYLTSKILEENCDLKNRKCFLMMNVKGEQDRKFTLGYTYNDHPFKMTKETIIQGPNILKGDHKINFILHLEKNKEIEVNFNSKGLDLDIFTTLINGKDFQEELVLPFPNLNKHDEENRNKQGFITNIFYSTKKVSEAGDQPELLISIRPIANADEGENIFDGNTGFVMQSSSESTELLQNYVQHELMNEGEFYYYHFYNSGKNEEMRLYINSDLSSILEVYLSKDLQSRPPFQDDYLLKKVGIGSLEILVNNINLQTKGENENMLKGYFTLAVKSSERTYVNIFWNQEFSFDFIDLTPGYPATFNLNDRTEKYFNFFAKDKEQPSSEEDRGIIKLYVKSSVRCNIFLAQNSESENPKPDKENYQWKVNLGMAGGITMLEILPSDPNYCINCTYTGYIQSVQNGQITLMVDIEHNNIPVLLTPNFTFPEILRGDSQKIYRVYNPDTDQMNLSFSVLSGYMKIYLDSSPEISTKKFVKDYSMGNENKYGFFALRPSDYSVKQAHDYYILIKNTDKNKVVFNISVIKNSLKMPIEQGIVKVVRLGPMESAEYFFKPSENQEKYKVVLQITNIANRSFDNKVKENLETNLEFYLINKSQGKFKLPQNLVTAIEFELFAYINVNGNETSTFNIVVYNPVNTEIQYNLLLESNSFKMVNLDETNYEVIPNNSSKIFEAIGIKNDYLFMDFRMCMGEIEIQIVESDYDKIASKEFSNYKTLKDQHSLVHYLKLEHEKVFIKVSTPNIEQITDSIFTLNVFNEKHLDSNPYTEIKHISKGIVHYDTENQIISFDPIDISSFYDENFRHQINYKLYVGDDLKILEYAKNCKNKNVEKLFPNGELKTFKTSFYFRTISEINASTKELIKMKIEGLTNGKKYYGIVICRIKLFPPDLTQVRAIKVGSAYYDSFILVTPKYSLNFRNAISIMLILGVLLILYNLINSYVFGKIGQYKYFEKLSDLENLENSPFGINTVSILEEEYYEAKPEPQMANVRVEDPKSEPETNPHEFELKENDKHTPLEMSL